MPHNSYISIGFKKYEDLNSSPGSLIQGLNKRMRVEILNLDVKDIFTTLKAFSTG